jgi:hypothetical protein
MENLCPPLLSPAISRKIREKSPGALRQKLVIPQDSDTIYLSLRSTTGYRFTNSSTFFLMAACSDLKAECNADKSRCRVSSLCSDAMSEVSFRILSDSLGMRWVPVYACCKSNVGHLLLGILEY